MLAGVVPLPRLRRTRERQALTIQQLAERTGLHWQTIARIERGENDPRPPTVRKLADALGCLPADLMEPE